MINLEELSLCLTLYRLTGRYIDGTQLHDEVLRYMPRLTEFHFSIETTIPKRDTDGALPSNDVIQRSFVGRLFRSVRSQVDVSTMQDGNKVHDYSFSDEVYGRCHIYSLPYHFTFCPFLSNSFQGDTFKRVRSLSIADTRPFEDEFFRLLSQCFPSLRALFIYNATPQVERRSKTRITFAELRYINVNDAHSDYATQFLVDEHCHLPYLRELHILWPALVLVTENFTSDATRLACSQVKQLQTCDALYVPDAVFRYFSSA